MNMLKLDAIGPCPTIERVEGGYELIGCRRDDPDLPEGESRIFWPDSAQMVPELAELHIADLGDYLSLRLNLWPGVRRLS